MSSLYSTKKALLIGGSGFLGRSIYAIDKGNLFDFSYDRHLLSYGIHFNLEAPNLRILERYDTVVVVAGLVDPRFCQDNPELSSRINSQRMVELMTWLKEREKKIIFTSSEYVYSGSAGVKGDVAPEDLCPINLYGSQKVTVELSLRDYHRGIVLRLPKMLTITANEPGLLTKTWDSLRSGETILAATDQVFSPIDVRDVYEVFRRLLVLDISGVYNCGGPNAVSRYDIVTSLARRFCLEERVRKAKLSDFDFDNIIPTDVSMDSSRLFGYLNYFPYDTEAILDGFAKNVSI